MSHPIDRPTHPRHGISRFSGAAKAAAGPDEPPAMRADRMARSGGRSASRTAQGAGPPVLIISALLLMPGAALFAQSDESGGADQPTLDELLELDEGEGEEGDSASDGDSPAPDAETTGDESDTGEVTDEVERMLGVEKPGGTFASAVSQMEDAARRLSRERDAGAQTQRLQADVLKKLDQVLAKAKKRRQSGGGGGQSGQQQQQNQGSQGQNPSGQSSGSQQGQAQTGASPGGSNPSGGSGEDGPTGAEQSESLESLREGWGNLPPRLRDELSEGLGEPFNPIYRSLTESYYRRLAEQMQSQNESE